MMPNHATYWRPEAFPKRKAARYGYAWRLALPNPSYRIVCQCCEGLRCLILHAGRLDIIEAAAFVRRFSPRGLGAAMPSLDRLDFVSSSLLSSD